MKLILTEQQVGSYKTLIKDTPTHLSPLPHFERQAKGLAADLPAEATDMLRTLANTKSTAHLNYCDRNMSIDTAVYYANPDEAQGVLLTANDDGVRLQSPPVRDNLLELLLMHLGNSKLDRVDFELDLPMAQTAAFFALIDASRRNKMRALLGESTTEDISIDNIKSALTESAGGFQWLAPGYIKAIGKGLPGKEVVTSALSKLADAKIIKGSGNGWIPGMQIEKLASEFLLIDAVIRLRSGSVDAEGGANAADIHIIYGRSGAVFMWSLTGKKTEIRSLSPSQLLMLIEMMMRPAAENTPNEERQANAEPPSPNKCAQCGAKIEADDKFCCECGTSV